VFSVSPFESTTLRQLLTTDKSSRQKKNQQGNFRNKQYHRTNNSTDIYRLSYPTALGYTFYMAIHGTFSKIDHILEHNTNLINARKLK
jgi:hypothetical protein